MSAIDTGRAARPRHVAPRAPAAGATAVLPPDPDVDLVADPGTVTRAGRIRRAALEVALLVVVYLIFTHVQGALGGDGTLASHNGHGVQSLERALGIDLEGPVNAWTERHPAVAVALALVYPCVLALVPISLAVVVLVRPAVYRAHLRRLVWLSFASLPVFWLFPVSPPRLDQPGIVDVVAQHSIMSSAMSPDSVSHANLYAATPSLHVAWGLWCGMALRALVPHHRRGARIVPMLLPALVAVDVVATGNHYVVDVVAGAALALLAAVVERRVRAWWNRRHALAVA